MKAASLAIAAIIAAAAAPARADHTESERITDASAYSLRPGEVRLGPFRSAVGLPAPRGFAGLEIGSYPLPWLAWIARTRDVDVQLYNAQVKATFLDRGRLALGFGGSVVYGSVDDDGAGGSLLILPVESHLAYRLDRRFTLAGSLQYSLIAIGGGADSMDSDASVDALVEADTAHLVGSVEFRASRTWAFIGEARLSALGRVRGEVETRSEIDEFTEVEAMVEASAMPFDRLGYSGRLTAHYSRRYFNLRLGLGYGNVVLPVVNLASPVRTWLPSADVYLRF